MPFSPSCLDRALAARWMLVRRGDRPTLTIGLQRDDLEGEAHAWLTGEHGGTVTGASGLAACAPVTDFR